MPLVIRKEGRVSEKYDRFFPPGFSGKETHRITGLGPRAAFGGGPLVSAAPAAGISCAAEMDGLWADLGFAGGPVLPFPVGEMVDAGV